MSSSGSEDDSEDSSDDTNRKGKGTAVRPTPRQEMPSTALIGPDTGLQSDALPLAACCSDHDAVRLQTDGKKFEPSIRPAEEPPLALQNSSQGIGGTSGCNLRTQEDIHAAKPETGPNTDPVSSAVLSS